MVKLFALQTSVFIIKIIHDLNNTNLQNQAAKQVLLLNSWKGSKTHEMYKSVPIVDLANTNKQI